TSIESRWNSWKRAGALVTEMECSTLFVICQVRGWRAGGILAAIGDTEKGELIIDPERGQKEAIAIAIEGTELLLKT
ncbi:MAG: hypothetical protein ACFFAJ_17715, partial [Candidatus Hodarchaeota archaeon]